jgi:glutathione synthase
MKTPGKTLVFVMDPIESVDIQTDTTFALMLEAQRRDHRVFYADPADLAIDAEAPVVRARPVTLRREPGRHADVGEMCNLVLDEEVDVVLQRTDPPVDAAYVTATQILTLCRRALVLNRPAGILAANEKLYALHFPDLMPPTRVTRSIPQLVDFMAKLMVVKPLDGRGGEGIFHVRADDRNLNSLLEQSTRFETLRVMAQQYLPDVRRGDKRILILDGEPIGAVLRVPAEQEFRANFHVGGKAVRADLDGDDRRISERIAPALRRDGLFFVGIDVIGGLLTEVNVTSPTGVQEINRLEDRHLEVEILDGIERKLAEHRAGS